MKFRLKFCAFMCALFFVTVMLPQLSAQSADSEAVQLITVSASRFKFEPSEIRVKPGTTVRIKITATDHAHGFKISLYPDGADKKGDPGLAFSSPQECIRIEEGQTTTVEFVARKPGTYDFRCCVVCGFHHHAMKGRLIVE